MEVINFIFVLAIVVPLAVLMIYLLSNLSNDVKESCKNAEAERQEEKDAGMRPDRTYGADRDRRERTDGRQYPRWGRASEREDERRPERGQALYRQKKTRDDEEKAGGSGNRTERRRKEHGTAEKPAMQPSKRKRRKERKNRRKVGRDQK